MAIEITPPVEVAETEVTDYPGLEFTPPKGTVDDALEGEALVKWKKVGDKYTIVEFEGSPLEMAAEAPMDSLAELTAMDESGV